MHSGSFFNPTARTLRQFAAAWTVFFSAQGYWQAAVRGHWQVGFVLLGLALTVGPVGFFVPRLVRPIFVGMMCLAFPLNWLVMHLVLAVLFYGVFTPIALVFRLIGRDVLVRRRRPDYDTYWVPKPVADDLRSYFRLS